MSSEKSNSMLVSVISGIIAFPLAFFILPTLVGLTGPPDNEFTNALIGLSVLNSIAFAFGTAFVIIALQKVRNVQDKSSSKSFIIYLALAWELVSWGMHDNYHIAGSEYVDDSSLFYADLLNIELVFHFTIQIAAIIAGFMLLSLMNDEFSIEKNIVIAGMSEKKFMILSTIILAILAFAALATPLGNLIPNNFPPPPNNLLPFFILLEIIDDFTFGLGISFIIVAFKKLKSISPAVQSRVVSLIISLGWIMVAALIHVKLHLNAGPDDILKVIYIDYGFHITIVLSSAIAAKSFYSLIGNELARH